MARKTTAYAPTFHRDGSVTYWSVYEQQWRRSRNTRDISDREYSAMGGAERGRIIRHMKGLTGHKHAPATTSELVGYISCVCPYGDCAPRSHGGVSYVETCSCGATRAVNSTGFGREEHSDWLDSI